MLTPSSTNANPAIPSIFCQGGAERLEIVSSLTELEALRPAWTGLCKADSRATPFQSPAWTLSWARRFAPDRTQAVAVWANGELIALTPFFTWRGAVLLAGTGPSDYNDGLFASTDTKISRLVLNALAAAADMLGCATIDLQQLRPDSPLLQADAPSGWSGQIEHGEICPVVELTGKDGLDALSSRWRKNARRAERALIKTHSAVLDVHCTALSAAVAADLVQLHTQRWQQRGEAGVLADEMMRDFIAAALPALAEDGLLRLHRITVAGRAVAMAFIMPMRQAAYAYLGGFDPAWARYSPGMVAVVAAMRHAAEEGACEFHFLRGREAYKYRLGAQDRPTFRRALRRI